MSQAQKLQFLRDTRDQAVALLEDFAHFREILARPDPFRGELRRISATLRRLLIERSITMVAGPRIGKFLFTTMDNKQVSTKKTVMYFAGGAPFGTKVGETPTPLDLVQRKKSAEPNSVKVRLDGFLNQPILGLQGKFATRKDVVEYVAYNLQGVHNKSTRPRTEADDILDQFKLGTFKNGTMTMSVNLADVPIKPDEGNFIYDENEIDLVLHAIYSTINFIMISDDVERLESVIRQEIGAS